MAIYLFILLAGIILLTGSALLAFRWALRTGQLQHPAKTALQIFDEDEPVGMVTDWFPGHAPPSSENKNSGRERP